MIKINQAYSSVKIQQSIRTIKIEKVDVESQYLYLSPYTINQEDKEVKHAAVSNQTT